MSIQGIGGNESTNSTRSSRRSKKKIERSDKYASMNFDKIKFNTTQYTSSTILNQKVDWKKQSINPSSIPSLNENEIDEPKIDQLAHSIIHQRKPPVRRATTDSQKKQTFDSQKKQTSRAEHSNLPINPEKAIVPLKRSKHASMPSLPGYTQSSIPNESGAMSAKNNSEEKFSPLFFDSEQEQSLERYFLQLAGNLLFAAEKDNTNKYAQEIVIKHSNRIIDSIISTYQNYQSDIEVYLKEQHPEYTQYRRALIHTFDIFFENRNNFYLSIKRLIKQIKDKEIIITLDKTSTRNLIKIYGKNASKSLFENLCTGINEYLSVAEKTLQPPKTPHQAYIFIKEQLNAQHFLSISCIDIKNATYKSKDLHLIPPSIFTYQNEIALLEKICYTYSCLLNILTSHGFPYGLEKELLAQFSRLLELYSSRNEKFAIKEKK